MVRAPFFIKPGQIEKFLAEKRAWIDKVHQRVRERLSKYSPKQFIEGERFLYLGREYALHIAEDMHGKLLFEDRFILAARHVPKARRLFERWYREEAFLLFTKRCRGYGDLMGVRYQSIKLSSAKKRWGSCHPQGTLCFNWRLVMAPQSIVDYVVVHELAHLKEANHSRRFWALVERYCPGYREAKRWLADNAMLLAF